MDRYQFMSSKDHLRQTLKWGGWPENGTTVEDNRKDLARHWKEFERLLS